MDIFRLIWTAIVVRSKMFLLYYCVYPAIAYNIFFNAIVEKKLPEILLYNDKIVIFVLSIISSYILSGNTKQKGHVPQSNVHDRLNILKPGQQIR